MSKSIKVLNIITLLFLFVIYIFSSIIIGSPMNENYLILNISICILAIINIFANKILKTGDKVIQTKLDLIILLFSISSIIPIIFGSYTSMLDAINTALRYISIFAIYYLIKNICKDTKYIKYILNIIIISSIILVIFGIDEMTFNSFSPLLEKFDCTNIENIENRMFSNYGYTNAFAAFMSVSFILLLGNFFYNKDGKKYIFCGILTVVLSAILLTYSKGTFLILGVILLIYMIMLKNKEKTIQFIEILSVSFIMSALYTKIFENMLITKEYTYVYIVLILLSLITVIIDMVIFKLNKYIYKIKTKILVIFSFVFILMCVIIFILLTKFTIPLNIFNQNESSGKVKYNIVNIEPNKEYSLNFNITSNSRVDSIKIYKIIVNEENKYGDTVKTYEEEFNNFNGDKVFNFKTSEKTTEICVMFTSLNKLAHRGFTVNSFKINGEEYPLKYKYLPYSLVSKIQNFKLDSKSVSERWIMYEDGITLASKNIFTGIGGNSWKYRLNEFQQYRYEATVVHSYFIQILLEFGIISLVLFILIIVLIIYYFIKKNKEYDNILYTSIFIAIIFTILHSFIDFDLSFMHSLVTLFILIGIMSSISDVKKLKYRYSDSIAVIILLIAIYTNTINFISNFCIIKNNNYQVANKFMPYNNELLKYNYTKSDELEYKNKGYNELVKYNPYINVVQNSLDIIKINLLNKNLDNDFLDLLYNRIFIELKKQNLNIDSNINKILSINNCSQTLLKEYEITNIKEQKEYSILMYKLIIDNYEKIKNEILDKDKNRYDDRKIEEALIILEKIYQNSLIKVNDVK